MRRSGALGLLTALALTATMTLAGAAWRGYLTVERWAEGVLGRFEMEAFLSPEADAEAVAEAAAAAEMLPTVESVTIITKDAAAERFQRQFGEDITELVGTNPLPPSLVVTLKRTADPAVDWKVTEAGLRRIAGVEDVVYAEELLARVQGLYRRGSVVVAAAAAGMVLVSLLFTQAAIRAAVRARRDLLRVIALSGGTRLRGVSLFAAMGAYFGLLSGLAAVAVVEVIAVGLETVANLEVAAAWGWPVALAGGGVLLEALAAGAAAWRQVNLS